MADVAREKRKNLNPPDIRRKKKKTSPLKARPVEVEVDMLWRAGGILDLQLGLTVLEATDSVSTQKQESKLLFLMNIGPGIIKIGQATGFMKRS